MLYTAFYVFTVGEIVPRASAAEFGFSFLLESICTIVNAIIIGYMTQYMGELAEPSQRLSDKINVTNTAMINLKLSRPLKMDISKFIYNTHTTKTLQDELDGFLKNLKPGFRDKVTKTSFSGVIEMNFVTKAAIADEMKKILSYSQTMVGKVPKMNKRSF